jgi:hypothetical protein
MESGTGCVCGHSFYNWEGYSNTADQQWHEWKNVHNIKLAEPLVHMGYTVWVDDFTFPAGLAKFLLTWDWLCKDSIWLNRYNVPTKVKEQN